MLRSALELRGYRIDATDGEIGKVHDVLFDDARWNARYLVVDTGSWLNRHRVVLAPQSLGQADWAKRIVRTTLTKQQIEDSPPIDEDEPVSRQVEKAVVDYFEWPIYWAPATLTVGSAGSGTPPPPVARPKETCESPSLPPATPQSETKTGDPHLRSAREVAGYGVAARDGEIGHIEDFVLDDEKWVLRYVVVDTRNWLPGRKVLLAPDWFIRFDWEETKAETGLDRARIENAPPYDPAEPVNRDYEGRLYDYYGRPGYWTELAAQSMGWKI